MFGYDAFSKIYIEAGPQFGFLIDQKEEVEESPFRTDENILGEFHKFDAGLAAGLAVKLTLILIYRAFVSKVVFWTIFLPFVATLDLR